MPGARSLESNPEPVEGRGAQPSAPRPTPLTMVSAAVAGDDLHGVAGSAADALGRTVAIALPGLGPPVLWPRGTGASEALRELAEHAAGAIRGRVGLRSARIAELVPVRIGHEIVGIVAALGPDPLEPDQRAWLEAAAAAAAVTALMREAQPGEREGSRRILLQALAAGPAVEVSALLAQARRWGVELGGGAVALCAQQRVEPAGATATELPDHSNALLADVGGGRALALVPYSPAAGGEAAIRDLVAELGSRGLRVAVSAPRRNPSAIHEALREAELLIELAASSGALLAGQEETYRLLIGVLLRDPEQLESLRETTISPSRPTTPSTTPN